MGCAVGPSARRPHFLGAEATRWGETVGQGRWARQAGGAAFPGRTAAAGIWGAGARVLVAGSPSSMPSAWLHSVSLSQTNAAERLPLAPPPATHSPAPTQPPAAPRVRLSPAEGTRSGPTHVRRAEELTDLIHQVDHGWMTLSCGRMGGAGWTWQWAAFRGPPIPKGHLALSVCRTLGLQREK